MNRKSIKELLCRSGSNSLKSPQMGLVLTQHKCALNMLRNAAIKAGFQVIYPSKSLVEREDVIAQIVISIVGIQHGQVFGEYCGLSVKRIIIASDQNDAGVYLTIQTIHTLNKYWPTLMRSDFEIYVLRKTKRTDEIFAEFKSMASLPQHVEKEMFKDWKKWFLRLERPSNDISTICRIIFEGKPEKKWELAKTFSKMHHIQFAVMELEVGRLYSTYFYSRNLKCIPSALDGLTKIKRAIIKSQLNKTKNYVDNANELGYQVDYKEIHTVISKAFISMAREDFHWLSVLRIIGGCKGGNPNHVYIECLCEVIQNLYPDKDGDFLLPILPIHFILGWNQKGECFNSIFQGNERIMEYMMDRFKEIVSGIKPRTPKFLLKTTHILDEQQNVKKMTLKKIFDIYFNQRLNLYKKRLNSNDKIQALQLWRSEILNCINKFINGIEKVPKKVIKKEPNPNNCNSQ